MVDATRALLDELMGKQRDLPAEQRTGKPLVSWKDKQICKYALGGLCPYNDLFKNTKSALGPCKYEVHDDDPDFAAAKADWDSQPEERRERYGYRRELLEVLRQLVRDLDRKIERNKERAAKESQSRLPTAAEQAQLDELQAKERAALKQSEEAAEAGDVDASLAAATQAEALKRQHAELLQQATMPAQTLTVCEVSGVYATSTDNDQRKADHLAGKQYLGWLAIREKLAELEQEEAARGAQRPPEYERSRAREREGDGHRSSSSRREERRSSGHDRHRSDRERDRDKPRDRDSRRRSRSRDRHRGSEVPPPDSYSRGSGRR